MLPWNGKHVLITHLAKSLLSRVREEIKMLELLNQVVASDDLSELKSAIEIVSAMNPPFDPPVLAEVKSKIEKLGAEAYCKEGKRIALE
jgi:hypothetical protein